MENLLPATTKLKWYFKSSFLVITFLIVGPLVLPLIIWHPTFSPSKKLFFSSIVLVLSYLMGVALVKSLESINAYYALILS